MLAPAASQSEVQGGVYLLVLAHSRCLINSQLMISWVHGPAVVQSGHTQTWGNWLSSPLNRMCGHGYRKHLCGMRLLIQINFLTSQGIYYVDSWMTLCGTRRPLKRNFIAAFMFQASLQRWAFSHEWLLRKITIPSTVQVPDSAQED